MINHHAEIVAFRLTSGNVNDRTPIPEMVKNMKGKAFDYKDQKKRKNKRMSISDKILLKKRVVVKSINNLLKNSCQIKHHRHKNRWNFLSNLMLGIAIYCLNLDKPRLFFHRKEIDQITIAEYVRVSYVKLV